MLTPEVIDEAQVLLSVELERRSLLPHPGGKLVLGACQDGLILIFPAFDSSGKKGMHLVRVYESTLRSTRSEVLIKYYEDNRETAKQTIEEFALSFRAGWNALAGLSN
jgi:hypothetical protein